MIRTLIRAGRPGFPALRSTAYNRCFRQGRLASPLRPDVPWAACRSGNVQPTPSGDDQDVHPMAACSVGDCVASPCASPAFMEPNPAQMNSPPAMKSSSSVSGCRQDFWMVDNDLGGIRHDLLYRGRQHSAHSRTEHPVLSGTARRTSCPLARARRANAAKGSTSPRVPAVSVMIFTTHIPLQPAGGSGLG